MKRLNQGHLHSKLEVPGLSRLGTEHEHGGGNHSRKERFEKLVNSYWENLHMSAKPVENARHMAPPVHGYMNIHELHQDVGRIEIARHQQSICQDISTCKSRYSLSNRTDHVGVTTMKRLDQGHLHSKLEVSGRTYPGRESNPGLHSGRGALKKRAI